MSVTLGVGEILIVAIAWCAAIWFLRWRDDRPAGLRWAWAFVVTVIPFFGPALYFLQRLPRRGREGSPLRN